MRLIYVMLLSLGLTVLMASTVGMCTEIPKDASSPGEDMELREINSLLYGPEPPELGRAFRFVIHLKDAEEGPVGPIPGADHESATGILFHNWRGFAIKGNDSRALRVSIECIRPIEPVSVRRLLTSNMTLEEVRQQIRREEGATVVQGVMKLSDRIYRLVNIQMTPTGERTLLEADLAELRNRDAGNETSLLGRLSVSLAHVESDDVSEGTLLINGEDHAGRYKVLLNTQDPGRGDGPPIDLLMERGCRVRLEEMPH